MAYTHLNIRELVCIEAYTLNHAAMRFIARHINRSIETVARVVRFLRQGHTALEYLERYVQNKRKCGRKKIFLDETAKQLLMEKLRDKWSPDVAVGRMPDSFPCTARTIYRRFKDGTYPVKLLPMKGRRKPNGYVENRGKQAFRRHISERIEDYPQYYQEFGHFEGDTIIGMGQKDRIITLVERRTKIIVALRTQGCKASDIEAALDGWLSRLPATMVKSITFDCGKEFSNWRSLCNKHDISIYFADPGCPSQRGLNENSNGILRRNGLPKKMNFSRLPSSYIVKVINERNGIPRRSLGYRTPLEVLCEELKKAGYCCLS